MEIDWYSIPKDLSDSDGKRIQVSVKDMAAKLTQKDFITEDEFEANDNVNCIVLRLEIRILYGVPIYDPKDDSYGLLFCNPTFTVADGQHRINRIRGVRF